MTTFPLSRFWVWLFLLALLSTMVRIPPGRDGRAIVVAALWVVALVAVLLLLLARRAP